MATKIQIRKAYLLKLRNKLQNLTGWSHADMYMLSEKKLKKEIRHYITQDSKTCICCRQICNSDGECSKCDDNYGTAKCKCRRGKR